MNYNNNKKLYEFGDIICSDSDLDDISEYEYNYLDNNKENKKKLLSTFFIYIKKCLCKFFLFR